MSPLKEAFPEPPSLLYFFSYGWEMAQGKGGPKKGTACAKTWKYGQWECVGWWMGGIGDNSRAE